MTPRTPRSNRPTTRTQRDQRRALAVLGAGALLAGVISLAQSAFEDSTSSAGASGLSTQPAGSSTTTAPATDVAAIAAGPTTTVSGSAVLGPDVNGDEPLAASAGCKMDKLSVRAGDSGAAVSCVQQALIAGGYLSGSPTGEFDIETAAAAEKLQTDKNLFVDGIVGRETAIALDVWPDEESLVVRTPPPPDGAVDLMGYTLSYVAVSGDDPQLPPLPADSGSGKRVVYDRAGQRVWAVDKNDRVIRSWLVSGSKYSNELPGTHEVYSRSEVSTAWNGKAFLPKMVRWLKTDIGNIGFHGIPRHVSDNSRYQKDSELGTRLSGGCQRQADLDAAFMWDFAQVGTTVVVL